MMWAIVIGGMYAAIFGAVIWQGLARAAALEELQNARKALRSIANNTCCEGCQEAARVAKEALE